MEKRKTSHSITHPENTINESNSIGKNFLNGRIRMSNPIGLLSERLFTSIQCEGNPENQMDSLASVIVPISVSCVRNY